MSNQAKTTAIVEVIIKKSRFIGFIAPTTTVESAEKALEQIRIEHKAANHNCFAYSIGQDIPVERFSDDGEPSGTAGRPILEVIRRRELRNTLIVVTRYFGGTLLGANGLVRAYTETATAAVDAAELMTCVQMQQLRIQVGYAQFGKLEYELTQLGHEIMDKEFSEDVTCSVWVRTDEVASVLEKMANWSSGQAHVAVFDPEWVGIQSTGELVFGILTS